MLLHNKITLRTLVGYWESVEPNGQDEKNQINTDNEMNKENLTNWIFKKFKFNKK